MNFQEKVFESTQGLRARAAAVAELALSRVEKRVGALKVSLTTLGVAGRELEKVARRHGASFVKQNATIAQAARKDVTSLALTTFDAIAKRGSVAKKTRKPARKTASRARVSKAA